MKQLSFLRSWLLLLTMLFCTTVASAEDWVLTNIENLKSGDEVIIVGNDSYYLPNTANSKDPVATSIEISNEKITSTIVDAMVWIVDVTIDASQNNQRQYTFTKDSRSLQYSSGTTMKVATGTASTFAWYKPTSNLYLITPGRYLIIYNKKRRAYASSSQSSTTTTFYTKAAPAKDVTSIAIKTLPTKTTYFVGEELDLAGGEITVTYSDETTEVLSMTAPGVTVTDFDSSTTGIKELTVTYGGQTATFNVNVTERPTCTITWSVNGVTTTETQNQGATLVKPADPSDVGDFKFMGWATTSTVKTDGSEIAYAPELVPETETATYYAVFAMISEGGENGSVSISLSDIKNYGTSGHSSYSDNYELNGFTGRWLINNTSGKYSLQLGYNKTSTHNANNSHLTTPVLSAGATVVNIKTTNGAGKTLYLTNADDLGCATQTNACYGYGTTGQDGSVEISVQDNPTQFHIYPSATTNITSIIVEYQNISYGNYTTNVATGDNLVLNDNDGYENGGFIQATKASYSREVPSNNWQGICLPFDVTDVTGFATTIAEFTGVADGSLEFTKTEVNENTVMKANTPYLFKPNGTNPGVLELGALLWPATTNTSVTIDNYILAGNYTSLTNADCSGMYALSGGVFKQAFDNSVTLKPFRVYLTINDSPASAPAQIGVKIVGPTGVEDLTVAPESGDDAMYNVMGQKVGADYKGIVIKNGKKYINK